MHWQFAWNYLMEELGNARVGEDCVGTAFTDENDHLKTMCRKLAGVEETGF